MAAAGGRLRLSQVLLTLVLVGTVFGAVAFTWLGWTGGHVFNSEWHPHARFHAAQTVGVTVSLSLVGLYMVWRRSGRRGPGIVTCAVVAAVYWAGEFFAVVVPGTNPSPDLGEPNTVRLLGLDVHGNLLFSAAMVVLSALGAWLVWSTEGTRTADVGYPRTSGEVAADNTR